MQRRDISNEVIVALAAVGTLALALTFGVVLTLSRPGSTPTPEFTLTAVVNQPGATSTTVSSATPTASATATATTQIATTPPVISTTAAPTKLVPTVNPPTPVRPTQPVPTTSSQKPPIATTSVPSGGTKVAVQGTKASAPAPTTQSGPGSLGTLAGRAETATPTSTPTRKPTLTVTPKQTSTPTFTRSPNPPTSTQTATRTPIPTTRTFTNTPTFTPTATTTFTRTPTSTLTFTATSSRTPTSTPTFTATATPTFTRTPTRTPTFTDTPTDTPTFTPTFTETPTDTATFTETFTETPTDTPTSTDTPVEITALITATPGGCVKRQDWETYIVRSGDTMFHISSLIGISVQELAQANCITDPTRIFTGQVLVVPPGSAAKLQGSAPGATPGSGNPTPTFNTISCANPAARIVSPRAGATVQGVFAVTGTAMIPNFSFYKLEVRADASPNWAVFTLNQNPVSNGLLGRLDSSNFATGFYWLQLTVVDIVGNFPILPCAVRVKFGS